MDRKATATVVGPDEPAGQLAVDDLREHGAHRPRRPSLPIMPRTIATNTDRRPGRAHRVPPPPPPHDPADRRAGRRLQGSPVTAGVDDEGRIVVATYPERAKAANVARPAAGVGHRAVGGLQRAVGAGRRRRGADHPARRRGAARRLLPLDLRRALRTGTSTGRRWSTQGKALIRITPDAVGTGRHRRVPGPAGLTARRPSERHPGSFDAAGGRHRLHRDETRDLPCGRGRATPTRWAPPTTAAGTNFALFSEVAERVELCLFTAARQGDPGHAHRGRRVRLARLPAERRARASATATACTGPTTRRAGLRCNPSKLLDRPLRQGPRRARRVGRGRVRLPVRRSGRPQRHRLGAVRAEVGGGQPVLRLGHRPVAAHPRTTRR